MAGLRLYDTLLVNSVVDGMNLVAKEGPVVNTRDGVVIISESVGAYDQLRKDALSVSPTDIEGTMQAMYQSITMSAENRNERAANLMEVVDKEDVTYWLKLQVEDLLSLN